MLSVIDCCRLVGLLAVIDAVVGFVHHHALTATTTVDSHRFKDGWEVRRRYGPSRQSLGRLASSPSNDASRTTPLEVAGVSVSPTGFWVVLQANRDDAYVPLAVTHSTVQDVTAATSPQALTMLQLLANVDMAGVIFPPTLLSELVVTACQGRNTHGTDLVADEIVSAVQSSMDAVWRTHVGSSSSTSVRLDDADAPRYHRYTDWNPWMRSRVRLPQSTLRRLTLAYENDDTQWHFTLDCSVQSYGTVSFRLSHDMVHAVLNHVYAADEWPPVTESFVAVALALRYRTCDMVLLEHPATPRLSTQTDVARRFWHYQGRDDAALRLPATRSAHAIATSFEIHALQAALTLARQKGDDGAAAKIRVAIDALDEASFQNIPVQAESETDRMQ